MELRPELTPPILDEMKVHRLAELAARLDGVNSLTWEDELAEFNRLTGTPFSVDDFQNISGAETHEEWVRRILFRQEAEPIADISRDELTEIVRRAMPQNGHDDCEWYMAVLDANTPSPGASSLIFYPMDYDPATNTWDGGRQMGEYDPTPEQIVEWVLGS